eukprot:g1015.t1
MNSEKPSSAERIGAGFRNVQNYLRGRKFPGTVRLRRGQDQEFDKTTPTKGDLERDGKEKTSDGNNLSNLPIEFEEQRISQECEADVEQEENGRVEKDWEVVSSLSEVKPCANRSYSAVRIAKLEKILDNEMVNLDELREVAWSGISPKLRPKCWKLLLSYLPPNRERQESVLSRKRKEYHDLVAEYYYNLQDIRTEEEIGALRQVVVDVPRTAPGVQILQTERLQKSLEHILYVWGIRHPASGYVQGINDLVTPFLIVFLSEHYEGPMECWDVSTLSEEALFDVEADSYWCLCKLLDSIQDHYTTAQPGIQKAVFKIRELIRRIDGATANHLDSHGIDFLQFAFRWVNCLLLRELPFSLAFRLWDTYLAEGSNFREFLVYICSCFLLHWSEMVKTLDFQDVVMLLQRPPTQEWSEQEIELVLSKAFICTSLAIRNKSSVLTHSIGKASMKSDSKVFKHTHSYLQILGNGTDTGETTPSILLFFDSYRYVFNIGEGFQRYCFQHRLKWGKLCDVFLTRMSTEAAGGVPGLAITMSEQGRSTGVESSDTLFSLHGPLKLDTFINAIKHYISIPASHLKVSNFGSEQSKGQLGSPLVSNEQVEIRPILILPESDSCQSSFLELDSSNKAIPVSCYICQLADVRGKFLPEKAKSLGVKMGPDCGRLVDGCCVEGKDGQIIRPEQVMEPTVPGPVVLIVDCPDSTYITPLITSTGFQDFFNHNQTESRQLLVVHLGPQEVIENNRYFTWMKKFPQIAEHIIVNKDMANSMAIMRKWTTIQAKLNLVDEHYFPMPCNGSSAHGFHNKELPLLDWTIRGRDLLKFHLKPSTKHGVDQSQVMETFDHQRFIDDFKKEDPEVNERIQRFREMRMKHQKNSKIAPNELEITFLGTGASIPSKYRNVTGIYLDFFDKGSMLLDCGEGSYGQLIRRFGKDQAEQAIKKLKCIWISHIHADHHIGLPTILMQRQKLVDRNDPPLLIIGPPPLYPTMQCYSEMEPLNFSYVFAGDSLEKQRSSKKPKLEHRVMNPKEYFTEVKECLNLTRVDSFPVDHCAQAYGIVLESQSGWKVVFSGDTRPCSSVIEASRDATLLIHEATFEEDMEDEAFHKKHSTTREAIDVARQANAYRTILTHFSQRYPKIPFFKSDAEDGVSIAFDLMSINLSDLEMLPFLVDPCQVLFKKEEFDQEEHESNVQFQS